VPETAFHLEKTDRIQFPWQRYHKHLLLLYVAFWLGFLPYWTVLRRNDLFHCPPCPLQPSGIWLLWHYPRWRSIFLHACNNIDDVSDYFPTKPSLPYSQFTSAVFVEARNRFQGAGIDAKLGQYAFGFTWGAWACMLIATVFLFMGCGASDRKGGDDQVRTARTGSNMGFFRRQRERRARGSFVDNESQRRVKDEYA
jgi:hypothetical protein